MPVRTYYYGVRRVVDHKEKIEPFVIRKKIPNKGVVFQPPDALVLRESAQSPDELKKVASEMLLEYYYDEARKREVVELPQLGDVSVGSVATHDDGEGHHQAIILDLPNATSAWAIFFSSKQYGRVTRVATKDEIALAGFVSSKTTYLNLVMRPVIDFFSCGITFPDHRITDLRREYLGI
ncbi:hypothetical protein M0R72_01540 [Candidatus Pacearchaeota archaeon]|jgi:hypothetical protein|nr:hypothetical protein [Candidatus Pacearchaeota archaeon]